MGRLRLNFWLPTVTDSRESILEILSTNNSTKIRQNPKLVGHVYWDQDKPFDEEKGVKKSRWTVPLTQTVL